MSQKYTRECYLKGNPSLNLALNERELLIKALVKADWHIPTALKHNFPHESITQDGYRRMLAKHHISPRNKNYKMLNEID